MQESQRQQYLQAMGIQLWESRISELDMMEYQQSETGHADFIDEPAAVQSASVLAEPVPVPAVESISEVIQPDQKSPADWESLKKQVETCTLCGLHEGRIYPVFGAGDRDASVMVIGEAPGADEDRQGEPFTGQAGQLFNKILFAAGFQREQVFITNIIKCRPPGNRDPHINEVSSCMPYLKQQIQWVKPDIILAVGRIAAHNLLNNNTNTPLSSLRGSLQAMNGLDTPVIVTYHPAYLLRKPSEKGKVWEDMQLLTDFLSRKD